MPSISCGDFHFITKCRESARPWQCVYASLLLSSDLFTSTLYSISQPGLFGPYLPPWCSKGAIDKNFCICGWGKGSASKKGTPGMKQDQKRITVGKKLRNTDVESNHDQIPVSKPAWWGKKFAKSSDPHISESVPKYQVDSCFWAPLHMAPK